MANKTNRTGVVTAMGMANRSGVVPVMGMVVANRTREGVDKPRAMAKGKVKMRAIGPEDTEGLSQLGLAERDQLHAQHQNQNWQRKQTQAHVQFHQIQQSGLH